MKNKVLKKILLSLVILSPVGVYANIPDYNFNYQDYMDFGQNKGKFKAGATNLSITDKNGNIYSLNVPMPDFIGITDAEYGTFTFIGGSYMFGATHVGTPGFIENGAFYKTISTQHTELQQGDTMFHRMDKFVTTLRPPSSFLQDYRNLDASKYSAVFRSGQGIARYRDTSGQIIYITNVPNEIRTGGRLAPTSLAFQPNVAGGKIYVSRFEKNGQPIAFSNVVTQGDSGSPLLAYDIQLQQWVVLGSVSTTDLNNFVNYAVYNKTLLDTLIANNTNPAINLNNQSLNWSDQTIGKNLATKDKDIVLTGGGTITLTKDIDQGYGGIYFDSNQTYTINSKSGDPRIPTLTWKGAGVYIGENTTVNWYLDGAPADRFHKIGKGTLVVHQSQFMSNVYLNVGEGTVVLNTAKDNDPYSYAFRGIIIGSGRATIEIGKEGSLREDYLFFTRDGGTLDFKGTNATFNYILASDIGAKITNTDANKISKLTLGLNPKGIGSIDSQVFSNAFLYHGQIGDYVHIYKDASGAPSNSNPSLQAPTTYSLLAFDGNIYNPHGYMTHKNGNLTFQGHPVIHAYLSQDLATQVKNVTGDDVYTTPTRIDQKDWENRIFIFDHIDISKESEAATLVLGRSATLLADINASETQIRFGGSNADVYVDKYDGENVKTSTTNQGSTKFPIVTFYQSLSRGINQKDDSFYFEGNIQGKKATEIIISNTSSNPINFGQFNGIDRIDGSIKQVSYSIKLDSTSSFQAKHIKLHGANQIIFDTLFTNKLTTNTYASFMIEHLSLLKETSSINANLFISSLFSGEQSTITFSSIRSRLNITGGILTLSPKTQLIFDAKTTDFLNLHYDTPYILIQSQNPIIDQREDNLRSLVFINYAFDTSDLKNIIEPNKIGFMFSRKNNTQPSIHHDWFENYILDTINEQDTSIAEQKLQIVLHAIGDNRPALEAIVRSNLNSQSPYQDLRIDQMIIQASQGNIQNLKTFSSTHSEAFSNTAKHALMITDALFNQTTFKLYSHNSLRLLLSTLGFFQPQSPKSQTISLLDFKQKQDYPTPYDNIVSDLINQTQTLSHNLWAETNGGYFSLDGTMLDGGIAFGYDYTPPHLASKDCFFNLGISLGYSYLQYKQTEMQEEAHFLALGIHSLFLKDLNELIGSFYIGNIWDNAQISSLDAGVKSHIIALDMQIFYKYQFYLQKLEEIQQIIKPIVGLEYFYGNFPQADFVNLNTNLHITYPQILENLPIINLGVEYNIATLQTTNIFSFLLNYRFNFPRNREILFGNTPLNPKPQTKLQDLLFKIAYEGNYSFQKDLQLTYSLLSQFDPKNLLFFGVQANLGMSWKF